MMIPEWLLSPRTRLRLAQERKEHFERLAADPVPWDEDHTAVRHGELIVLAASTWKPVNLFGLPPMRYPDIVSGQATDQQVRRVGAWVFYCNLLPRGERLAFWAGARTGEIGFDADVIIPALARRSPGGDYRVWASLAPAEVVSQRPGVRRATGDCVVGGLGLGHFLARVCARPSVRRVLAVEQDKELLGAVLPAAAKAYPPVAEKLAAGKLTVLAGDAYDYADHFGPTTRHLFDIWSGYPDAHDDPKWQKFKQTHRHCWAWGDVQRPDRD